MTVEDEAKPEEQLEKQAIAWFTRMNGRPSPAERADFETWLGASDAHARQYRAVEATWTDLGALAGALDREQSASLTAALDRVRQAKRARRRGSVAAGVALSLALLLGTGWLWLERPHLLQDWRADLATARGEQRTIALADGSTVQLDADTAIAIEFTPRSRQVRLLRGTAFFEVVRSERPFVVAAQEGEAMVLGTSFEVATREDGAVAVTLVGGSLEVRLPASRQAEILKPGESVAYDAAGLGRVQAVDAAAAASWRAGRVVFDDIPLETVLQRIGRYRHGRIVLLSPSLGQRRVTGNLSLRDTDAALAALQSSVGFSLSSLGRVTFVSP
ncbi:FecR family protein [Bosea sp. BH3]|uniref:FecR family protein n=1 Tax=Bosea sp. BH3 TaxID=2871701 RepID=UPI0021CB8832|nr:FecR domain-containing protein [Bosea sp. BH3]MCU4178239.1 FecR domain-containing protein [Bosea sp. BH3]